MFVDGRNRTAFILALLTLPACMYFVPGSLLNQGVEVQQIIAHAAHTDKRKMSFRTAATELPAIDLLPYNMKPPPGSFCVSRDFLRKECWGFIQRFELEVVSLASQLTEASHLRSKDLGRHWIVQCVVLPLEAFRQLFHCEWGGNLSRLVGNRYHLAELALSQHIALLPPFLVGGGISVGTVKVGRLGIYATLNERNEERSRMNG